MTVNSYSGLKITRPSHIFCVQHEMFVWRARHLPVHVHAVMKPNQRSNLECGTARHDVVKGGELSGSYAAVVGRKGTRYVLVYKIDFKAIQIRIRSQRNFRSA